MYTELSKKEKIRALHNRIDEAFDALQSVKFKLDDLGDKRGYELVKQVMDQYCLAVDYVWQRCENA